MTPAGTLVPRAFEEAARRGHELQSLCSECSALPAKSHYRLPEEDERKINHQLESIFDERPNFQTNIK